MIEDIVLSPVIIFLVFGAMLLIVSRFAFRRQELPGYALGWLMGIFFIIVYQSLTGSTPDEETVEAAAEAATDDGRLSFIAIMIPSILGISAGAAVTFTMRSLTRTHARRSALVAVTTAALVSMLFLLTVLEESTTRLFGLFAIAFAIGALGSVVFRTSPPPGDDNIDRARRQYDDDPPQVRDTDDAIRGTREIPAADLDEARSRFDEIRRRITGGSDKNR